MQPIDRILSHVSTLPDDVFGTLTSMKREMGGRCKLSFTVYALDGDDAVNYRLEWARRLKLSRMFDVELREYDYGFYVCARPNEAFRIWRDYMNKGDVS